MIQALIFDLDGTLANTEELHFRSWQATLLHNGVEEFTFEQFLTYIGSSNEKLGSDFIESHRIPKTLPELIREKQQRYMQLIPEIQLFPGALELMKQFHPTCTLAVASSSHQLEIHAILKHHNIFDYMAVIYGGDMVTYKKPDPEIYLKTAQSLQIAPQNCLAFEDSNPGIMAAKAAGMHAIAIPNSFTQNHDFTWADRILQSFNEFNSDTLADLEPFS